MRIGLNKPLQVEGKALYYGSWTHKAQIYSKERDMDKSINATYSRNKDSVSGDFSVGTKDGNSSTETKSFPNCMYLSKHWGRRGYNVVNTSMTLSTNN